MSNPQREQQEILSKLKIKKLNPMQKEAGEAILTHSDVVLLSPTGSGKTLAFLLPIIKCLKSDCVEVQCMILVPSRELAIQIEQVVRSMGTGFKVNAVYGGRSSGRDKMELQHRPAILIGTPGRIASLLRREQFSTEHIRVLILDEFDKSLEVGFTEEMREIIHLIPKIEKRILTSATFAVEIPDYVGMKEPITVDHAAEQESLLQVKQILSPTKDKLDTLFNTLCFVGNQPGIIFCNYRDSIERISSFLRSHNIDHGCFHGGMEQVDREESLIKFRNGTHQLLIATDLAARGIDIPQIQFILHYHLPNRESEFTHRNGRTARMLKKGTAYVLRWEKEELPSFIEHTSIETITKALRPERSLWQTLCITGGRKSKISKGDIVGLFFKKGNISAEQIGLIEIQNNYTFVAVHKTITQHLIKTLDRHRLKKTKIRIRLV